MMNYVKGRPDATCDLTFAMGLPNGILRLLGLVQERSVLHRSEVLHMCLGKTGSHTLPAEIPKSHLHRHICRRG